MARGDKATKLGKGDKRKEEWTPEAVEALRVWYIENYEWISSVKPDAAFRKLVSLKLPLLEGRSARALEAKCFELRDDWLAAAGMQGGGGSSGKPGVGGDGDETDSERDEEENDELDAILSKFFKADMPAKVLNAYERLLSLCIEFKYGDEEGDAPHLSTFIPSDRYTLLEESTSSSSEAMTNICSTLQKQYKSGKYATVEADEFTSHMDRRVVVLGSSAAAFLAAIDSCLLGAEFVMVLCEGDGGKFDGGVPVPAVDLHTVIEEYAATWVDPALGNTEFDFVAAHRVQCVLKKVALILGASVVYGDTISSLGVTVNDSPYHALTTTTTFGSISQYLFNILIVATTVTPQIAPHISDLGLIRRPFNVSTGFALIGSFQHPVETGTFRFPDFTKIKTELHNHGFNIDSLSCYPTEEEVCFFERMGLEGLKQCRALKIRAVQDQSESMPNFEIDDSVLTSLFNTIATLYHIPAEKHLITLSTPGHMRRQYQHPRPLLRLHHPPLRAPIHHSCECQCVGVALRAEDVVSNSGLRSALKDVASFAEALRELGVPERWKEREVRGFVGVEGRVGGNEMVSGGVVAENEGRKAQIVVLESQINERENWIAALEREMGFEGAGGEGEGGA
ncbi:hypothetical protein HDV00_005177 [Rhizophlyctis rosea]|nr:hypothetical protein HDV00_005177 [Rhizophlyctis rosea]